MVNKHDYLDDGNYYYDGDDLGVTYSQEQTKFRLWAPTATKVKLLIYDDDHSPTYERIVKMEKNRNGTWLFIFAGDLAGKYYKYRVYIDDYVNETVGPYARAVGENSERGLILDMSLTNPWGWEYDRRVELEHRVDAVIYELHVRDFSISPYSGIKEKGKFLGFTERETTNPTGLRTGVSHLQELGITHVHLLPVFDFGSVDDRDDNQYNWGYDPHLYNVPEGSYATNPSDDSRIGEFKELVKVLHDCNIGVVMDVVYNHTFKCNSPFNLVVPDYYYRFNHRGDYSNGSGCGNEIASERPMVRKFIIHSVKYWAEEYHIDGFRFDLMALLDRQTIEQIVRVLHDIDPSILIYGEPWIGGDSPLPPGQRMKKGAQQGLKMGLFNDHFRNAIKGDNDGSVRGFISGDYSRALAIKKGVVGGIRYNDKIENFTSGPGESVNYVSSHDDLTLWDKLQRSNKEDGEDIKIRMDRLAQAIIFTSQGIAFMAGGEEFLRTKFGEHNSYNAGDEINQIKWERKNTYFYTFKYYQGLIRLRLNHPAFRMFNSEQICNYLKFIETPSDTVGFTLHDYANDDSWREIVVFYNPRREKLMFNLPGIGKWNVVVNDSEAGITSLFTFTGNHIKVSPISAMVLYKN